MNSQNDGVYGASRKADVATVRLIRERQHFSHNAMVSVGVSRMGKTGVIFIEPDRKSVV